MEEMTAFLDFDFQIAVTFPGEVINHNGVLEERTVVWDLDEEALADAELFAEARKVGSFPWAVVGGVLLGLIVIGVVTWSVLSRRRRPPEGEIVVENTTAPIKVVVTEE
ncbi:MAG: LppM family (lipo)protein, partial [bacterium]